MADEESSQKGVVPPTVMVEQQPPAGRDPIFTMIEIAKATDLSDSDKTNLIMYAQSRFNNRRKMAYVSLWSIVGMLIFVGVASIADAAFSTNITGKLAENETLVTAIVAFLTAIVGAYYGVSAWRPSS